MDVMKISCIEPPEKNRSRWAREILAGALARELTPAVVAPHELVSFTVTLPPQLTNALRQTADRLGRPVSEIAAGLIENARAVNAQLDQGVAANETLVGRSFVKSILHPLAESSWIAVTQKKIAFAEAAPGTGAGTMIASLAATAVATGRSVIISAPLSATWQLIEDLSVIPEALSSGVALLLGRADFVSPLLLCQWAVERQHQDMLEWIDGGGKPRSEKTINAGKILGVELNWLLKDAMELAENIPAASVSIAAASEGGGCAAERVYEAIKARGDAQGIQICSHDLLASDVQQSFLWTMNKDTDDQQPPKGLLSSRVDLLLIHEAHLFEQAMSTVFTRAIYFKGLRNEIREAAIPGRRTVIEQIDRISKKIQDLLKDMNAKDRSAATGKVTEFEGLGAEIQSLESCLAGLKLRKKDSRLRVTINATGGALRYALSGHFTIRLERSPQYAFPHMVVGKANLEAPLENLWDQVESAVLVSATLYTDGAGGDLTRWKLAIPKERIQYLSSVYPEWTYGSVIYRDARTSVVPDNSAEWIAETVANVRPVTANANGGTLILCTSTVTANQIAEGLAESLGSRLIVQGPNTSASYCATRYRAMYWGGAKPVWVGLGDAWTTIDLREDRASPADVYMVSDLVIPRLPMRLNRSLSHQRRVAMLGATIDLQEANLHFRQGLGRLVLDEQERSKNLWVLDCRLDQKKAWASGFNQTLARYPREPKTH